MALVRVRERGEITLPRELQEALKVREGDTLEAEAVEGGILLKPVSAAEREAAWQRIEQARSSVRPTPEQAAKPIEVQEQEILEVVDEVRREYAEELRRRRR
jgi:AbrB family looped-hinge helix DNA binding protein